MDKIVYCFVFCFILMKGYGQTTSINIAFQPSISNESIELNTIYSLTDSSKIEITTCRFYVSNFTFYSNNKLVSEQKGAFLIDLENPESLQLSFPFSGVDAVRFNLGIDSSTNVAGILDGDLDPIKGMYWTWNSGYINSKFEGSFTKKDGQKIPFEYHLGGYLPPYTTLQTLTLSCEKSETIFVKLDLSQFITSLEIETCNNVMIPGPKAVELSRLLTNCFKMY
jgi:hypothetical protein